MFVIHKEVTRMDISSHRIENVEVSDIRQQDSGGYVRDFEFDGDMVTLFADEKENLEFEV
jgi:hypothetical protein